MAAEDGPYGAAPRYLKIFECFLQVAAKDWPPKSGSGLDVIAEFVGALYSQVFLDFSPSQRYEIARRFLTFLRTVHPLPFAVEHLEIFDVTRGEMSPFVKGCIWRFESIALDEERATFCRGWPVYNAAHTKSWLNLAPFYLRVGEQFAADLHAALGTWYSAGRAQAVPALSEFCQYLAQLDEAPSLKDFRDSDFMAHFWRQAGIYFVNSNAEKGNKVHRLPLRWKAFGRIVVDHLTTQKLFAAPTGGFPQLPRRGTPFGGTHLQTRDGIEYSVKLLTPIPLYISDSDALKILFHQIQRDITIALEWALSESNALDKRVRTRRILEKIGTPRMVGVTGVNTGQRWLTDPDNATALANAAATLKHHGYVTPNTAVIPLLFPKPIAETARALGLPLAGSLLPHCAILVHENTAITPSLLENLELYNRHGVMVGLTRMNGGWYLKGNKFRRGPNLAPQVLLLTRPAFRAIARIIRATAPLREYLKKKGDDRWRLLLLSGGKGFGEPVILNLTGATSNKDAMLRIAEELSNTWSAPAAERKRYVEEFSLPALRASVAVNRFLKSGDVRKMAEELGHAQYSRRLLSHYLPEPLLAVYRERWIRIAQEGLILQALQGSNYLLRASSFTSIQEVDDFLKLHAFKLPSPRSAAATNERETNKNTVAAVGVDAYTLSLLLSVQQAVAQHQGAVQGEAHYWATFAEKVVEEIEAQRREDLQFILEEARRLVDPKAVEAILHA